MRSNRLPRLLLHTLFARFLQFVALATLGLCARAQTAGLAPPMNAHPSHRAPAQPTRPVRVIRHFDPGANMHVMSSDDDAKTKLPTSFQRESIAEGTPDSPFFYLFGDRLPGTVPLYRFRTASGSQRFTLSAEERTGLRSKGLEELSQPVYVYKDPAEGASEIFCLTNPANGDVVYTTSQSEKTYLTGEGWAQHPSVGYAQSTSSSGTGHLFPGTIKLLDEDLALLASPAGDGSKLVFARTNEKIAKLGVGDILYAPTEIGRDRTGIVIRKGLMRRVMRVTRKGAGLEVETDQAKYRDLFHDFQLYLDNRPAVWTREDSAVAPAGKLGVTVAAAAKTDAARKSFDALTEFREPEYLSHMAQPVHPDAIGASLSFTINVNGTLSPGGVSLVTLNGGVTGGLTGEINFNSGCSDSIDLLFTSVCDQWTGSGTVLFTPTAAASITASVDAVSGLSVQEKAYEIMQTYAVGDIPVSVIEDLFVGASITDQATATFSASASAQGTGGFAASLVIPEVWDSSGSWIGCPNPCPDGFTCGQPANSSPGPTCTVSANAGSTIDLNPGSVDVKVWVTPQISAGPGIDDLSATVNFALKNAIDFNFSSSAITGTYMVTPSVGYQVGACFWGVNIGESGSTDLAEIDVPIFGGGSPTVTTNFPSSINLGGALLDGDLVPTDLPTSSWFNYCPNPSMQNALQTPPVTYAGGMTNVAANLTGLKQATDYYTQLVGKNILGTTKGQIMMFHVPTTQTITFPNPGQQTYGVAPFALKAASTSGLPVTYTVLGPGVVNGSTLSIIGSGQVTILADQPGNTDYVPAAEVSVTFMVMPEIGSFGTVAIGTASPVLQTNFTLAPGTQVGSIAVLTQGAAGKDFAGKPMGWSGNTFMVDVTFTPKAPGARSGAVVVYDTSTPANVLATAIVSGIGEGPQIIFNNNPPPATLHSGFQGSAGPIAPFGLAVDGSGNAFVASYANPPELGLGTVTKISASGAFATIQASGYYPLSPAAIQVDGAGNLFVLDKRSMQLNEILAPNYTTAVLLSPQNPNFFGFSTPKAMAIDANGNLFVADTGHNQVWEILASSTYNAMKLVASGLSSPTGVAVDASGNVYIADTGNNAVKEALAAGGYTTVQKIGSGFSAPGGLAVDAIGNVFVADTGNNAVKEILSSGGYATVQKIGSGFSAPRGVVVDASGNAYVADTGNNAVKKLNFGAVPSVNFASTSINATSSDSPWTLTIVNDGNAPLVFPFNPVLPAGFPLNGASTCPQLSASGSPAVLAAGASCSFMVSFTPTAPGPTTGTLVLTDSNLNASAPAYATQNVEFSGTGLFPAVLTAQLTGAANKTYDGTTSAAATGCALNGVLASDTGFVTCSIASASFVSPAVGNNKTVAAVLALSGPAAAHYVLSSPTATAAASILPATLTVTANGLTMPVGGTVPALTAAYSGFVNGEGPSVVTTAPACTTTATSQSIQGNYPITCSGAVAPNYDIQYVNGKLIVSLGAQFVATRFSPGSGFSSPGGVAVDAAGNVYLADTGNNAVKQILIGNNYQTTTLASGFLSPAGVALDSSGNVYVADTGNNAVKRILASGGFKTVQTLGSGFTAPSAVAVDAMGNVFVADSGNNAVKEILATGGYATVKTLGSGFKNPTGVALDSSGDLFVADQGNNAIKEIAPLGGYRIVKTLGSSFSAPYGIALDNNWNIYLTDTGNGVVKELMAPAYTSVTVLTGGANQAKGLAVDTSGNVYVASAGATPLVVIAYSPCFPTLPVGSSSLKFSYYFSFLLGGSIAAPAVLTQNTAGDDFRDAGTGSCTTNGASHAYKPGDSCTVDVVFTPTHPGVRLGSVQLTNTGGALVATALVSGSGTSPQVVYSSNATPTMLGSGLQSANGVAVDDSGNVFIADTNNNAVKEILAAGGYTTVKTLGSGFFFPTSVAVDGDGNVFVADAGNRAVKEIVKIGGYTRINTLGTNWTHPVGVAIDGAGNVFVSDSGTNTVYEILWGGLVTPLSSSFNSPAGLSLDSNSNVFVADSGNNAVKEILAAGGYTTVKTLGGGFSSPSGVQVEPSGNVLVADNFNSALKEIVAASGYTTVNTLATGLNGPTGVAMDKSGNLFLSIAESHTALELPFSKAPTLKFASTAVGKSSAAQTIGIANNGNAVLLAELAGALPAASMGFKVTGGTCVKTLTKGSAWLAAGASCTVSVAFAPVTGQTGTVTGTLTFTDNHLNLNPATHSIALTGAVAP